MSNLDRKLFLGIFLIGNFEQVKSTTSLFQEFFGEVDPGDENVLPVLKEMCHKMLDEQIKLSGQQWYYEEVRKVIDGEISSSELLEHIQEQHRLMDERVQKSQKALERLKGMSREPVKRIRQEFEY